MKKILLSLILILVFSSSVIAEEKVYFCSQDSNIGFEPSENYEESKYITQRFKAKIDFQNLYFSSPDLYMTSTECNYVSIYDYVMQCSTNYGSTILINKINLKFGMSDLLGTGITDGDSLSISHGSCSRF